MKCNRLITVAGVAVVAGAMTQATVLKANAQENAAAFACQYVGTSSLEPLGDREGHSLRDLDYSCLVTAGPLTGGVLTGRVVFEMDKSGGTLLIGGGVIRKPGATAVYQQTDAKLEITMSEGKVIGVTTTGHDRYVMAVGSAASMSGKSFAYTTKPTGPGQFSVEEKVE